MNFVDATVVKDDNKTSTKPIIAGRCAMYCPRCGRQSTANDLRFCSHCGFKLGVVKASLADDDYISAIGFVHNANDTQGTTSKRCKHRADSDVRWGDVSRPSRWT